jgi:hypothetical protein
MLGARAAISCLLAALALPGCVPASTPIAGDTVQVEESWF